MNDGSSGKVGDGVRRLASHNTNRRLQRLDAEALDVLQLVSAELGVPAEMLLQPSRGRAAFAHARQLAIYLCYVALGRRMATVARLFGRDPSTVSYACARVEDRRDDQSFDDAVSRIEDAIASSRQGALEPEERIRAAG